MHLPGRLWFRWAPPFAIEARISASFWRSIFRWSTLYSISYAVSPYRTIPYGGGSPYSSSSRTQYATTWRMWENKGPRGTRPVFNSTGMWCSPSMTTASGRPERPRAWDTNSFGFSAVESTYTRSPRTAYRARVARAISSAPIDRYRKKEAPMSHASARASNPCARASFCTPWRETAAVARMAAAIAVPRITRSEISLSSGVATRSARKRK